MSQAQIEQFASRISNDPAMFNQLMAGTQTPEEFINKAVALGGETGFSFSQDEAQAWINSQIQAKANGELSDLQLEGVAGGKGSTNDYLTKPISTTVQDAGEVMTNLGQQVTNFGTQIENWFSSW